MTSSPARVKTRILILSDTHGLGPGRKSPDGPGTDEGIAKLAEGDLRAPTGFREPPPEGDIRFPTVIREPMPEPLPEADVAIHCGDLTKRSSIDEFEATFSVLRSIRAPLKLFIAGNHDLALDKPFWERNEREPDTPQQLASLIDQARQDGVQYLTEGTHNFTLHNGGLLRVYASPYTPAYGYWAFQYNRERGHDFAIPPGIDVAVTHGPPLGILDTAGIKRPHHEGCPHLFRAVHRAKPRIHCFGHIHEAWGIHLATWKPVAAGCEPSHETAIDAARSRLETDYGTVPATKSLLMFLPGQRRRQGPDIELTGEQGAKTLFVNAAIMDIRYRPTQSPWTVDIDLPKAQAHVDMATVP